MRRDKTTIVGQVYYDGKVYDSAGEGELLKPALRRYENCFVKIDITEIKDQRLSSL